MRQQGSGLNMSFLHVAAIGAMTAISVTSVACSSSSSPVVDAAGTDALVTFDGVRVDGAVDGPTSTFTLTSPALTEGGVIPVKHSCRGTNVSPPLAWTAATGQGYALVVTDKSIAGGFVHSAMWDIPKTTQALDENIAKIAEPPVPAGAKQPLAYDNQTRGYLGPCPPSQHTYEFALYAVSALPLPGLTLQSNRAAVVAAVMANQTAVTKMTGTFTP